MSIIEILVRDDCANSPKMKANFVAALRLKGMPENYSSIDVTKLPESDYRRSYGTPTVLINGNELFGLPRPEPTKGKLS